MKQLLIITMLLITTTAFSQEKTNKEETYDLAIKTSIQCEMCTDRLTDELFADFWAVKKVDFDIPNQMIFVNYNKKRTSPEEIRERISQIGYDADSIQAKIKPYMALPECCKKGYHIPEEK